MRWQSGQLALLDEPTWTQVDKWDSRAVAMADRHYSRRTKGSTQFMPPGETLVLMSRAEDAVFGWWRPHPSSAIKLWSGLDGWTCTIFRNEGDTRSSDLILAAEFALKETGRCCGPDGMITYVWDDKVGSSNPGWCFQCAGWKRSGKSADGKKTLLTKPWHRAGLA
jgi:hypothetical protein